MTIVVGLSARRRNRRSAGGRLLHETVLAAHRCTAFDVRHRARLRGGEDDVFGSLHRLDELAHLDHIHDLGCCVPGVDRDRDAKQEHDAEHSQRAGEPARGSISPSWSHWNHYVTHPRYTKRGPIACEANSRTTIAPGATTAIGGVKINAIRASPRVRPMQMRKIMRIALLVLLVGCTDVEESPSSTPLGLDECDDAAAGGWKNNFLPQSTGRSEYIFKAVPVEASGRAIDAVIGFSDGRADAFADLGPILRFNPQGFVDARNGGGRALAGFSTGGSLYGYRTVAEQNPSNPENPRKAWVIHEPEALIVRRIFTEYDSGASGYKAIAERLNAEGIPAPRDGRKGHKTGVGWGHSSIRAILTSAKYVGTWTWNTTEWSRKSGKSRRRDRPASEHVTREMPELAIVDRALWDRVQSRMTRVQRTGTKGGRPAGGGRPYLVSGLLLCASCGGPMSIHG